MLSKELLERFKRGEVVFHMPTQEIFYKVAEAVQSIGLPTFPKLIYGMSGEQTSIDFITGEYIGYAFVDYYRDNFTELEIITLKLSDFDSEMQAESAGIKEKLMEITRAIAYCRKLEETYDADLELDGLYTAREEILRELEDSLEVHI